MCSIESLVLKIENLSDRDLKLIFFKALEKKKFLENIFNELMEGILVINSDLEIIYANKSSIKLIGLPNDFLNNKISKYLKPVNWSDILNQNKNNWYHASRQVINLSYPNDKTIDLYVIPHNDNDNNNATIIINDITLNVLREQKNIEKEQVKLISLITSSMAHEIKNPLNSLSIHTEFLIRQFKGLKITDKKNYLDSLNMVQNEINRLNLMLTNFLENVSTNFSSHFLEIKNIKKIINEIIVLLKYELNNRNIKIKLNIKNKLPIILGNIDQLKQVFLNLIKNSIQSIGEDGTIEIKSDILENGNFLKISIIDNGHGITKYDINNLFTSCFSTKIDNNNFGFGLFIVNQILKEHNASISIDSDVNKKITIFSIIFPTTLKPKINLIESK